MVGDRGRLRTLARALWHAGPVERVKRRLEDRIMAVILDTTRVTNDGSYRRYRDDPTSRGERLPEAAVDPTAVSPGRGTPT